MHKLSSFESNRIKTEIPFHKMYMRNKPRKEADDGMSYFYRLRLFKNDKRRSIFYSARTHGDDSVPIRKIYRGRRRSLSRMIEYQRMRDPFQPFQKPRFKKHIWKSK